MKLFALIDKKNFNFVFRTLKRVPINHLSCLLNRENGMNAIVSASTALCVLLFQNV